MSSTTAENIQNPIDVKPGPGGLDAMLAANRRWVETRVRPPIPEAGQTPPVVWFGRSDSRVPETTSMGAKPGEIFTHRNIANQFIPGDPSAQSVLLFAVNELKVLHVVVVGHSQCGGVERSLYVASGKELPPSVLLEWLQPLIKLARGLGLVGMSRPAALQKLVEESVKEQVRKIAATATIKTAWGTGNNIVVHGWVQALDDGLIRDLKVSVDRHGVPQ